MGPRAIAALGGALVCVALAIRALAASDAPRADLAFVNGVEPSSLDPAAANGVAEGRVIRALYEGLVVQDPRTLAPLPGMAESWEESADGLTWTFHVRGDSRWSDGSAVTARDFRFSLLRLLDPRTAADYGDLLWFVRGAKAWASDVDADGAPRTSDATVGITAPDERTLVLELEHPVEHLLDIVAYFPLAPVNERALLEMQRRFPDTWRVEAWKPEHLVTNGPYRLVERRLGYALRLAKNAGYWDRDRVALRTIDVLSSAQLSTNLDLYLTGEVAYLANASPSAIPRLKGREDFQPAPYLGSSFLRVNVTKPPLDDRRVRRALALAIDRDTICAKITRGGERPSFALVPQCLTGWTGSSAPHGSTHAERCAEARALLAEAGFGPGARELPTIELHYATLATNRDVMELVADGWRRELGVRTNLRNQEWKSYLATQRELGYDVSRSSWIADYADPATFLDVFASDSPNNRTGWKNARYDALLVAARGARGEARARILREAEALFVDELPILPLYDFATTNLVAPRLGGFFANALDLHAPKFWYWMDDAELAVRRATLAPGTRLVEPQGPRDGLHAIAR